MIEENDWKVIQKFRANGYALVIFSPGELRGASAGVGSG